MYIDQEGAFFYDSPQNKCFPSNHIVKLDKISANVSIYLADYLYVQNLDLHRWNLTNGDLGLTYSGCVWESCPTPFQSILYNTSTLLNPAESSNSTFGLDFRNTNSDILSIASLNSTMQLGGVKEEYEQLITWLPQPSITPDYHYFMIQNLQFCGSQLFSNYSTTWQVMIDTGASCLSLPGEMYDAFAARFVNGTEITSLANLPSFTFELCTETKTETFYLPLGIFAVDYDAGEGAMGPLTFNYKGSESEMKLCILRGSDIEQGGTFRSPPPIISFGNLALQSLYFASDFATITEGFANKLTTTERSYYDNYQVNPSCAAQPICVGDQTYFPNSNTCKEPNCDKYFFVHLDKESHSCVFNQSAVGFGLIFIGFIMFLEVVSFLLEQYTGYALAERSRRPFGGSYTPLGNAFKIDIITLYLSKGVAIVVDFFIHLSQRLGNIGTNRNRRTRLPRDDNAEIGLRAEDMVL